MTIPLLSARNLWKTFSSRGRKVTAVAGVSLEIEEGESLALIGPSAAGKSTIGRLLLGLEHPDRGEVRLRGTVLGAALRGKEMRGRFHAVFQDPVASLNPGHRVESIIGEPLLGLRGLGIAGRRSRIREVAGAVHLDERLFPSFPEQLSGGEAQRVALARALIRTPVFLVLDEATSALDAPSREELLDLLDNIQAERSMAMLVITHDLRIAARLCSRGIVLEEGRIVEEAPMKELMQKPRHRLTRKLLDLAGKFSDTAGPAYSSRQEV